MALDLYAGTLTRYYADAWEDDAPADAADLAEARALVEGWRRGLARAIADDLHGQTLDWSEDDDRPFFSGRPDWVGQAALVYLAAYAEHPEMRRPRKLGRDWTDDPAWQASAAAEDATPYQQVLFPELWLPLDLDFVFTAEDPAGNEVTIGSVPHLLKALHALAAATFGGTESDWAAWRAAGPGPLGDFDANARFGLAMALDLVAKAAEHRLCVTLDY